MKHVIYKENPNNRYTTAVLIKETALDRDKTKKHYVDPLIAAGVSEEDVIGFSLQFEGKKAPVKMIRAYLDSLLSALDSLGVTTLYCCDGTYFKTLTNSRKAEPHYGYMLPCAIKGYEHMLVSLGGNYQGLYFNPDIQKKIDLANSTVADHLCGTYKAVGTGIIHSEFYPESAADIVQSFKRLHDYPALTADIEGFSLRFYNAGISTIGFAVDQHNGLSIPCDYEPYTSKTPEAVQDDEGYWHIKEKNVRYYGRQFDNVAVKSLLRQFFTDYQGKLIWHNANYDLKVIIYELWMKDIYDTEGLLEGLEVMCRHFDDTQIITYLATNSTAGNKLSLKEQAHEFAGNWAQDDVHDNRKIPLPKLLRYNLVDCLSTWFTYNKHWPTVIADKQDIPYWKVMHPSVKVILQMELTGMPLDMAQVKVAKKELLGIQDGFMQRLAKCPTIDRFQIEQRKKMLVKDLADRREKAVNPDKIKERDPTHFDSVMFNPGSGPQLQALIYDYLGYDVIDLTDGKQPATGAKTILKVSHLAKTAEHKEIFECLIGLAEVGIIISTFIAAMEEKSFQGPDGWWFLFGSFKIGGTVSGRLSSSQPNLQNIPSAGTKYAKIIKSCFKAPPGWLFVGADFSSLEDRISALTTKDPMKLKVYTDGYDGHCLRAFAYFGAQMPDIIDTVESINSIADKYKTLRQKSKVPTFALTYGGTYMAIMDQTGMPEAEAKAIEMNYHKLYSASDEWVAEKIELATKVGYVEVAFGLRLRTPILAKTIIGKKSTPYEAQAEARTAGNALGQSYGLLNNRAGIEFQELTLKSVYRLDIRPSAHIHDAQYFMIRDNYDVVEWTNNNLTNCMKWQELPEIQHDQVKLGGELDLFYPDWSHDYTLPNGIAGKDMRGLIEAQDIQEAAAKAAKANAA